MNKCCLKASINCYCNKKPCYCFSYIKGASGNKISNFIFLNTVAPPQTPISPTLEVVSFDSPSAQNGIDISFLSPNIIRLRKNRTYFISYVSRVDTVFNESITDIDLSVGLLLDEALLDNSLFNKVFSNSLPNGHQVFSQVLLTTTKNSNLQLVTSGEVTNGTGEVYFSNASISIIEISKDNSITQPSDDPYEGNAAQNDFLSIGTSFYNIDVPTTEPAQFDELITSFGNSIIANPPTADILLTGGRSYFISFSNYANTLGKPELLNTLVLDSTNIINSSFNQGDRDAAGNICAIVTLDNADRLINVVQDISSQTTSSVGSANNICVITLDNLNSSYPKPSYKKNCRTIRGPQGVTPTSNYLFLTVNSPYTFEAGVGTKFFTFDTLVYSNGDDILVDPLPTDTIRLKPNKSYYISTTIQFSPILWGSNSTAIIYYYLNNNVISFSANGQTPRFLQSGVICNSILITTPNSNSTLKISPAFSADGSISLIRKLNLLIFEVG